jgi:hypothetical protein
MMKRFLEHSMFFFCITIAVLIVVGISYPAFSQIPPGGGGNPCPGGEPCDPEVPIAGIEWLIIAGGMLGFRKIYRKFQK